MKILVTGGKGTLGKPLVKELRSRGYDVYTVGLSHDNDPRHLRADIAQYEQIRRAVLEHSPNVVYNLAAEFGRHNGEMYTSQLWNTNVVGLKHLLHLQNYTGFKLIHASSSEVYGNSLALKELKENDTDKYPLVHHNDYAMSKWVNEQQIRNHLYYNPAQNVLTLRFFNAYGPGEEYHPYRSVVCLFCYKALTGQSLTVFQNYHRVFMYIDDFIPTLANASNFPTKPGEIINIGGVEYRSIESLVDVIKAELGGKFVSKINLLPQDAHNSLNKLPNIDKARELLKHNPHIELEEGVAATLKWMKEFYGL